MKRFLFPFLIFMIALTLVAPFLTAQEFRGSILGRVTDPSGAVVPGAAITIVNEATNVKAEAVSNDEGNYTVPFLLPGRYTVTVELPGFKKAVRSGVVVQVQDKVTLDFALQVGEASESVTVSSESPLLQTANADLGQVVTRDFLERLPITGQSPLNLADMAAGVVAGGGGYTSNSQNDITINGGNGANRGNDVTVDGVPNVSARQNGMAVTIPMADAVQEFKVSTTMFDASQGRSNGGALAFTTRGGTNHLHGAGYYYTRNRRLDANSWTNNRLGLPKPDTKFNMEGGVVGGPVVLPFYNGRDRTFFFFGFERVENVRNFTRQSRVPTALERTGDFSQTLAPNGQLLKIYNPFATVLNANGGFVSRPEFPGAKIPQNLLSPIGLAVLAQYPLPNLANVPVQVGRENWAASSILPVITKNVQARIDQQLGERQKLYVRVSALRHAQFPNPNVIAGASNFPAEGNADVNPDYRRNHSAAVDDTITFSPTLVGSVRYGFTRTSIRVPSASDGLDPTILKLPDIILKNMFAQGWPAFDLGRTSERTPTLGGAPRGSANDIHALLGTFNKLTGAHTLRWGVDYRMLRWNEPNPGQTANGSFTFNKVFTRQNPTSSATETSSGSALASALLGLPASGNMGANASLALQNHYYGLFFQDDYKVTPRLTINFGLRYEIETPFTERFDRLAYGFDPAAGVGVTLNPIILPSGEVVSPGALKGGLLFVNQGGLSRRQGKTDWNNFGPRVGFAWAVNNKTVVRAGFGIFFSPNAVNGGTPVTTASFNDVTPYVATSNGGATPLPGVTLSSPFPNGFRQHTGSALGARTELGNNITFVNPDRVLPYDQQWKLGIQRELPWQTLMEVAYLGSHFVKNLDRDNFNLNETPDRFFNAGNVNTSIPNPFLGVLPADSNLGQGTTIRINRLRVLYPQFNNVTILGVNSGRVQYHGLQTQVQKRLSDGVTFVANYAYSKLMEFDMESIINPRGYHTVAATDRPHLFRLFATADLPVGRGRFIGSNLPGWTDAVVGGWSLTWISKYTSGDPLGVTDTRGRPIPLRDPRSSGSTGDHLGDRLDPVTRVPLNPFIDPSAFASLPDEFSITPEPARYGWLRGPSEWNHNLTLFKAFNLHEDIKLELRSEIAGVFNKPQFGNPATNLANRSTFGMINSARGNRTVQVGAKLRF
ncbi:MAG TPA: carboxypeptidase-like regulatory domain-containing protein [Acidobacteriota bacterium]|jgi:hypothetical protein